MCEGLGDIQAMTNMTKWKAVLDILQAAADVTRTRTTRLSAIYLHNVALARLSRACGSSPEELNFASDRLKKRHEKQAFDVAQPPAKLSQR